MTASPALPPWIGVVVAALVCGGGILKGGPEERAAGAAFLIGWAANAVLLDRSWPAVQGAGLVIDGLFFLFLLALSLRTTRYWPLVACGFQLLAVLTHAAKLIDRSVAQWAYITAGVIWTYLVLIAMAVGTWNAWRDARSEARAQPV